MIGLKKLNDWLSNHDEDENLEFKEAKNQYSVEKTLRYCIALANEKGGCIVLGVTDKKPRKVVGTNAFKNTTSLKSKIYKKLNIRVEVSELNHKDGRVLVIEVQSRPLGHPMHLDGTYWMRSGAELVPMSTDYLRKIIKEGDPNFLKRPATDIIDKTTIISLLDIQTYFDLLHIPLPSNDDAIINKLCSEKLVVNKVNGYIITNLGALLIAKRLDNFGTLKRRAPRVIVYDGNNRVNTKRDIIGQKGYAVGFEFLIQYVNSQLPENEIIGSALRKQVRMYPELSLRELIANAIIHQDFNEVGSSIRIEIFDDRVEITNPGIPLIPTDRFVDEYKSRNEMLADIMRRIGICEEKSSGIDKVIFQSEFYQLPAPDFRVGTNHTKAILFSQKKFDEMNGSDRIRACYLHACLKNVSNDYMTNQTLRKRFGLSSAKSAIVSQIITSTIDNDLIKVDDPKNTSRRYARYIPYWG